MANDPKTAPLAYLERRVSDVLRGTPVRDLDEAFSAVRMQIEQLRRSWLRVIQQENGCAPYTGTPCRTLPDCRAEWVPLDPEKSQVQQSTGCPCNPESAALCEEHCPHYAHTEAEVRRLRAALRMIAGEAVCVDLLLGNADIARIALHGK
jgi:hypothetical protein